MRKAFQQARWSEPILLELGTPGQRGLAVPHPEPEIGSLVGGAEDLLPDAVLRRRPPELPELSQPQIRKHFLRLSQETMGAAVSVDIGQGTATMKYNPPVNDRLVRALAELHPLQDDETVQGLLEVVYRFSLILGELSGLERFSFQPGGGTLGIYANACIVRAYHAGRGESERDEVVTTLHSHPANAGAVATAGYRVVTLPPGPRGYVSPERLRAVVSERTAGLFITNPEDTGIFNPEIDLLVEIVHDAGGLCAYDQANANGVMGVTRAREAGFDLCLFNLHKTFTSPHGSNGPACGAIGATEELARFLPSPLVDFDGERYFLDTERPDSIGKVRGFHGFVPAVVRSYAWALHLGADGMREVARVAVLNSNYLAAQLREVAGIRLPYDVTNDSPRLEQIRYSLAGVRDETGVGTAEISARTVDFGVSGYFPGHHPWTVPEPMTLEPTESVSKAELDGYVEVLRHVLEEARRDPGRVRTAPERSAIHRIDESVLDDPERWALTWRAYRRKTERPAG
jgi:glycine dehydrogenase subunit 2